MSRQEEINKKEFYSNLHSTGQSDTSLPEVITSYSASLPPAVLVESVYDLGPEDDPKVDPVAEDITDLFEDASHIIQRPVATLLKTEQDETEFHIKNLPTGKGYQGPVKTVGADEQFSATHKDDPFASATVIEGMDDQLSENQNYIV